MQADNRKSVSSSSMRILSPLSQSSQLPDGLRVSHSMSHPPPGGKRGSEESPGGSEAAAAGGGGAAAAGCGLRCAQSCIALRCTAEEAALRSGEGDAEGQVEDAGHAGRRDGLVCDQRSVRRANG